MKTIKAEIIAIGTELLLGQIANTNAQWISEQFALHGIDTYYHTVVGDNLRRVEDTFKQAQERSNVIIVSGGLGPTEDDMTREAFLKMSQIPLVEHRLSVEKIEDFFKKRQSQMTPNNYKQARVFVDSKVIDNKYGMAPGMIVDYHGRVWIFIPGVPMEMKQMITDTILPYLSTISGQQMVIQSMIIRFIGIGEAKLEHELADIIHSQQNPTIAPLAQTDGLIIRLTAKADSIEEANQLLTNTQKMITDRVGHHIFGIDDASIEGKVYTLLNEQNKRISAAESITGGMFVEKLIALKGASTVCPGGIISYDAKVKEDLLGVTSKLIQTHGVVSEECAKSMAKNIRKKLDTTIGISFTGVAGPETLEGHPVGTVFIAVDCSSGKQIVEKHIFHGDRNTIRRRATMKGFELLFNFLKIEK